MVSLSLCGPWCYRARLWSNDRLLSWRTYVDLLVNPTETGFGERGLRRLPHGCRPPTTHGAADAKVNSVNEESAQRLFVAYSLETLREIQ